MDDSLKTLDLSAEGTISVPPVIPPVVSDPTPTPQPTIVTQSSGPTDKKPMGKKTKILAGVLTAILLFGGLGVGLFLSRQRQNLSPRAMPNTCTWETCGEDPNKWAAGAYDETRIEHFGENPGADAALLNTLNTTLDSSSRDKQNVINDFHNLVTEVASTANNKEITGINNFLNQAGTVLSPDEIAKLNISTNTSNTTTGPTLSVGAGGVQVVRTGGCADCGGLNQGGCDNNPTSKGGVAGPACGFGCVGGLHFCTNSGSCQASCPSGFEAAGPLDSNADIKNCLLTGKCDGKNAAGFTQASLIAASGGTSLAATGNKIVYDGGGITYDKCTTTRVVNIDGTPTTQTDVNVWCGGIPEAPASQPLLKNGFCGKTGITAGQTCDQQFKANFGFNYTGGCGTKSSPTGGDGSLGNLDGCGYSSSTVNGFQWTWDMYKGFTITSLGTGAQKVRYVCKDQSTLVGGCTCAVSNATCTRYDNSVAFDWNQCGVQQIDIDVPNGSGGVYHVSRNIVNSNCGGTPPTTAANTPSGGTNPNPSTSNPPSGSNPTPTPTTTTQSYACYQLSIMKNGNNISAASVQVGDSLIMRGFATATNTTVSKMRFVVSINGVAQAPVDVNASLISGQYQADLPYTITQAASYSVTTSPISP